MLNQSFHYAEGTLYCDDIAIEAIIENTGTPTYIYSTRQIQTNIERIQTAFAKLNAHIHYSAKANANLSLLRTVIRSGIGIDVVSAGEIYRALESGAQPETIVFAGVGKTYDELEYAINQNIGWINVENIQECVYIESIAKATDQTINVALRFNPDVTANTHPYIATGHGGAKFGLTSEAIQYILSNQNDYPHINFAGIHVHIGSQLQDIEATKQAIAKAIDLITPYPNIRTFNIGGGLPVNYTENDDLPDFDVFAGALHDLLKDYKVILEPGRSIIANAGILVVSLLYIKQQAGQNILITDGSMTELIRPALYQATHTIIPVNQSAGAVQKSIVVGPVCETADVLIREAHLPQSQIGDTFAILTAGAYGMVMASNYNARLRPTEVLVNDAGKSWQVIRRRETWNDLIRLET